MRVYGHKTRSSSVITVSLMWVLVKELFVEKISLLDKLIEYLISVYDILRTIY